MVQSFNRRLVAQLVEIGPFFAGDTGPAIDFIILWDTGGFVDLTNALVEAFVRRYDVRRKIPLGPIITSGSCEVIAPREGLATFSWEQASPVASVPVDPGIYIAQVQVTFPDGKEQESQRVIFEVFPNTA
jgi:hypothetical protein